MGIQRKHARETARYYILAFLADAASSAAASTVRRAMAEANNMKLTLVEGDVVWRQTQQGRTGRAVARVRSAWALQAAMGLAKETAGLLRKAPASKAKTKTKAVAAIAPASDVGEHAAFERHREAGGLRVAQGE